LKIKKKTAGKAKLMQTFFRAEVTGVLLLGLKNRRSRSLDIKNLQKMQHIRPMCLLVGG